MPKKREQGELAELAELYQRAAAVQDAEARRLLTTSVAQVAAAHGALDKAPPARDVRDAPIVDALVDKARASVTAASKGAAAALRGKTSVAAAQKVAAEAIAAEALAAEALAAEAIAAEPVAAEPVAAEPIAAEPVGAEPLAAEPLAAEPLAAEPLAAEPLAAEPLAAEPLAAEPLAAEPLAAEPVAAESLQGVSGGLLGAELGNFLSKVTNADGK